MAGRPTSPALTCCPTGRRPAAVGYVSQLGGADKAATGRENLLLAGRLYGLSAADATRRCDELAEVFDLGQLLTRSVRTYSGGQHRRLEVALGIMHRPQVLFLDEPTTGLDPQNRANLWDQLRGLRAAARRSASPPTTWTRPTSCATGWRSSITGASSRSAPRTSSNGGTRPTRSR